MLRGACGAQMHARGVVVVAGTTPVSGPPPPCERDIWITAPTPGYGRQTTRVSARAVGDSRPGSDSARVPDRGGRLVRASFGFAVSQRDDFRLQADLAGGALMDVGCYCVNLARLAAGGEPHTVLALARWTEAGVDATLAGTLEYGTGVLGQLSCS